MTDVEELIGIEEESPETEHTIYELFKWSLLLKGAISVAEVIVGIAIFFIPPQHLISVVQGAGAMLSGFGENAIVQHLTEELAGFSSETILYVAIYLLSRGLVKCALIAGLLRGILWTYPASLIVLGLFLCYQAYEIMSRGSVLVIFISLFDLIVMYLVWREWRIVLRHQKETAITH